MDNLINPLDVLEQSKCFTCRHRLSRVIEPISLEDKEYYLEMLDIEEDEETYELYIEQHKCLITDEDLDGIIRECSQYELVSNFKLIREYKF